MSNWKNNRSDECDIREDEEQSIKLQEIIDLLVTAGYFRARIKGLSAFDKVVGGMIWSMDSCNFDVNVDLLFQENSTIGQKMWVHSFIFFLITTTIKTDLQDVTLVLNFLTQHLNKFPVKVAETIFNINFRALTEKIVSVLSKMECPHRVEPHQIQGLDFIHIFPVIQWLVKRSVKVREERREFIRQHAVLKFERQLVGNKININQVVENIKKVQEKYRRRRLFKRKDNVPNSEELQVESTLLEYGFPYMPLGDETESSNQSLFSEAKEFSDSISLKIMGNVVNSQVQKIAQVSQQFAKLKMDIESSGTSLIMKQKDMMVERKNILLQEESQLEKETEVENQKLLQVKENLKKFEEGNSERSEINKGLYDTLQSLVLLEENLKKQEKLFREHCKYKLEKFQNLLRESSGKKHEQENSLADNQLLEEKEKVQALKLQIAKKNRAIAFLQRQLDEIPGRGELAQYQRRFLELYNEVAQKHEETKQFYTMYNTLDDTKLYLSKELSLLNSVLDNYSEAMSNAIDKEEFMTQFESIVSAIKLNKKKVEKRRAEERSRRDKLSNQLLDLVEQQRNYVNIVKQLKIECKKNEELLACFRKQV